MFQSTHSLRSATVVINGFEVRCGFQSTHSLRSATAAKWAFNLVPIVSIHALLAECDALADLDMINMWVSIHALLAECDRHRRRGNGNNHGFNPRTPCGVRRIVRASDSSGECFNPRTPCGVRLGHSFVFFWLLLVSIHALLAECDLSLSIYIYRDGVSIHALLAECDSMYTGACHEYAVSIHALLAECDSRRQVAFRPVHRFNPRTPCGVRPQTLILLLSTRIVSIHALLAECDPYLFQLSARHDVSIHALLAECDCFNFSGRVDDGGFNPRTPCGVRP